MFAVTLSILVLLREQRVLGAVCAAAPGPGTARAGHCWPRHRPGAVSLWLNTGREPTGAAFASQRLKVPLTSVQTLSVERQRTDLLVFNG